MRPSWPRVARALGLWLAPAFLAACGAVPAPLPEPADRAPLALAPPFALGAGFLQGRVLAQRGRPALQEGEPIPDFTLVLADGSAFRASDLAGRALLLNFWATWCGPCRHEIPLLLQAQAQHADALLVLAINVKENRSQVEAFAQELDMRLPIVLDADGAVVDLFQVRGYPTSVFVDAAGRLVATWQGVLDAGKLEALTKAALAAHPSAA